MGMTGRSTQIIIGMILPLIVGSVLAADKKGKPGADTANKPACKIVPGTQAMSEGDVRTFGDLKVRLTNHLHIRAGSVEARFDLKASDGSLYEGIQLAHTVCFDRPGQLPYVCGDVNLARKQIKACDEEVRVSWGIFYVENGYGPSNANVTIEIVTF